MDEQIAYLRKGASEIIPESEFRAKLEYSAKSGLPLRVKLGVDPTAPDLHLGHTVVLNKLRHFQLMGHTAVFLIGDFTAMVGDPTGQSETRPPLTREQVQANSQTYLSQVFKILDREKTEVRYNSEWLDKLTSYEMIHLCAKYRLARMLEHEDFRSRLAAGQPISVHELLYPLLVAYDSVMLKADVELGASEQKFNLLMGREIQREYGPPLQIALTMPILVGLDGSRKMSKSLGNYVGITESPEQMFGKLMSMPDELMLSYFDLLTDHTVREVAAYRESVASGAVHPMEVKTVLAREIVQRFHDAQSAEHAAAEFRRVFRDRQAPEEIPETRVSPGPPRRLSALLAELGLAASKSDAERLIKQNAVEVNEEGVADVKRELELAAGKIYTIRAGKRRFVRVVVG
ncbi:MAG: tyrosine--tRNA ligase [Bryobacteraceae bacterium]